MGRYAILLRSGLLGVLGLTLLVASCSGKETAESFGGEKQHCYANGTCNVGLTCFSNLCVTYGSLPDSGTAGAGGGAATSGTGAGVAGGAGTGRAGDGGDNGSMGGAAGASNQGGMSGSLVDASTVVDAMIADVTRAPIVSIPRGMRSPRRR